jgi:hypothetical protein
MSVKSLILSNDISWDNLLQHLTFLPTKIIAEEERMKHCIIQVGLEHSFEVDRVFRAMSLDVITVENTEEALDQLWENGDDVDLMIVETDDFSEFNELRNAVAAWPSLLVVTVATDAHSIKNTANIVLCSKRDLINGSIFNTIIDLCIK